MRTVNLTRGEYRIFKAWRAWRDWWRFGTHRTSDIWDHIGRGGSLYK